mgnify:FL=1|tara:strand:+ start:296 stop:463 length:168 start_codon:yes stop_codon:yes gene_type:complete
MKKQELYNIIVNNKVVFSSLTQMEMFERLEDLSIEFYQTGTPNPNDIKTEIIKED